MFNITNLYMNEFLINYLLSDGMVMAYWLVSLAAVVLLHLRILVSTSFA